MNHDFAKATDPQPTIQTNLACLQALARLVIAHRAYNNREIAFAGEVLAGLWDHTTHSGIREVYEILLAKPSRVSGWLNDIGKRW